MIRLIAFSALVLAPALPALADECPAVIREFEAALKTTEANADTKAQAATLIAQAREQDANGQPELCVETAEQALATLSQ
jgi:hypothetical protein